MAKELTTTRASVAVYNFVDDTVDGTASSTTTRILNDGHPPVNSADEIEGMFLRSRIDWTNDVGSAYPTVDANAGSSSVGVANIFQVMKIPDRAILHELMVAAPTSTAPTHSLTGSLGTTTVLNFQVAAYTNASKSTLKMDADGLGTLSLTQSGGAITGLPTISTSTPETRVKAVTVTSAGTPLYCPFGGYVEMQMTGGASTQNVTADGVFAGAMELIVRASKLPE